MPREHFFKDMANALISRLTTGQNWLSRYPTPSNPQVFPDGYSEADFNTWFHRIPAAHFVTEDMALDAWEKGFHIRPMEDEPNRKLNLKFNFLFMPSIAEAHGMARLYGHSILLLGFNDKPMEDWDKPVDWENAKLKYTVPIARPFITVVDWKDVPSVPKDFSTSLFTDLPSNIHPDRFFYIENTDATDLSRHGMSVLEPIGNVLHMQGNLTWSIGQRIWRAAVGIITLKGPKGLKREQIEEVLDGWLDINARWVGYIPETWDMEVHGLGSKVAPVKDDIEVLLGQISTGARVPLSVMVGSPKGATSSSKRDMDDYHQTLSSMQNAICVPLVFKALDILQKTGQIDPLPESPEIEFNAIMKQSFRDQAADIAGEVLSLELKAILTNPETPQAIKLELIRLFMMPGSLS